MNWRGEESTVSAPTRGEVARRSEHIDLVDSDGNSVFTISKSETGNVTSTVLPTQRDVVISAAETVQADADQSGSVFRLSHATASLVLPNTDQCVAGSTEFYVIFTGDTLPNGTVDAGSSLIDYTDIGAGGESGAGNQATPCHPYQLFHILYLGSNIWASNLTVP